jgi:hypothetical protein
MVKKGAAALDDARSVGDTWASNLALECFLLHARVIRDFFRTHGSADDVLARDFLNRPPRFRLSLLRSSTIRRRLNRGVAHLSYSRSRLGRNWQVRTLLNEINQAMDAFVVRLTTEQPRIARIVSAA